MGRHLSQPIHDSGAAIRCSARRGHELFDRPDRLQLIDFGFCEHDRFVYEYDFYSRWIRDIRIEKVFDSASRTLPTCIAGVGACPPESSGPVDIFMQRHDEHSIDDTLEWLQESLDDNSPMADMREDFIDRLRWVDNRFNRHEANTRLQAAV